MKYFWFLIILASVGIWTADYASAGMARITHDESWLTDSYKRDRLLNGMEYTAKPFQDSMNNTMIRFTFSNPTKYDYTTKGWGRCGDTTGMMTDWSGDFSGHYIAPYATTVVTINSGEYKALGLWASHGHMEAGDWVYHKWGCEIDFQ